MQRFSSIFSQLLQLFPRLEFEQAVRKHRFDYAAKGFTSWGQFVAMLFCQFGRAHSLREICVGLASCEGKLKHLGVPDSPKRSTLAYANANRPWSLYHTVFEQILANCQSSGAALGDQAKFEDQDLPRDERERRQDPDLDGTDRHAGFAVLAADVDIRLAAFESGRVAAAPVVRLPRSVRVAERAF